MMTLPKAVRRTAMTLPRTVRRTARAVLRAPMTCPPPVRLAAQEIVVVGVSLAVVLLSYPTAVPWGHTAAIVACAALPLRLRWPWLAMLFCLVGLAGQLGLAPAQFGLFRMGRTSRSPWIVVAWVAVAVTTIETTVFLTTPLPVRDAAMSVLFAVLSLTAPSALGVLVATRQRLAASLRELQQARAMELETRAERARSAERARISREIHDAVGHHATLIAVEAAALEATTAEPDTRQAAQRMRGLAKASLGEMRTALGLVADRGGIPEVQELVTRARQAGMQVDYTATPAEVVPQVGRAVFRIVQESLTNAAKHAPGSPVRVTITQADAALTVTITSGPPTMVLPGTIAEPGGLGLTGMAERAASVGGHLEVERPAPDVFTVRAHLPIDGYEQSKVDPTEPTNDGTEPALDAR